MRKSLCVGIAFCWAVLVTIGTVAPSAAAPNPNSTALISVQFSTDATDFVAASSKDISHVEIHFTDGRVVKDESMTQPNFSYEGSDVISSVVVKSGTTTQSFTPPSQECDPEVHDCVGNGND